MRMHTLRRLKRLALGLTLLPLSGCLSLPVTGTSAIPSGLQTPTASIEVDAQQAATLAVSQERARVCGVWLDIEFDRLRDTLGTISGVKAGNAARDAYCKP